MVNWATEQNPPTGRAPQILGQLTSYNMNCGKLLSGNINNELML